MVECVQDTYIVSVNASELTVCVSPPFPCTLQSSGGDINENCVSASVTSNGGNVLGELCSAVGL